MASVIKGILFLPTWKKSLPGAASREGPSTDWKQFKLWLTSPETFFCFAGFPQTLINADKPVCWKAWYGTDGLLHALGVDFPLVSPHPVIFIVGSGCQVLHYRWGQEKRISFQPIGKGFLFQASLSLFFNFSFEENFSIHKRNETSITKPPCTQHPVSVMINTSQAPSPTSIIFKQRPYQFFHTFK